MTPHIQPAKTDNLTDTTRQTLEMLTKKIGFTPNMFATMAGAPTLLDAYISLSSLAGKTSLSAATREKIALALAKENNCDYCLTAHAHIASQMGLSSTAIGQAMQAHADNAKDATLVKLAVFMVRHKGHLTQKELAGAREIGITDAELMELVLIVSLNIFTNYFNGLTQPVVDFPTQARKDAA